MRKGRSQRKSRASLPPLSTRLAAAGVSGAPSSRPSPSSPVRQVVIGLSEQPEARVDVEPPPPDAEVAQAEAPVRESRIPRLRPSLSPESQRAVAIFAQRSEATDPAPASVPEPDPFVEAVSATTEEPREEHSGELRPIVTPDEMSIPPIVGDLAVEPVAERFFSEGELTDSSGHEGEDDWDRQHDKAQRKTLPHVIERRARFSRYVTWAVGGAAVVCLAALLRTTMVHPAPPVAAAAAAGMTVEPLAPAQKAAEPVAVPVEARPVEARSVEARPVEARGELAAQVAAPKVDVPKAEEPKVDAPPAAVVADAKTAAQEKADCRKSLERGKLADAIAAGERAVALDVSDGEAWLLLGASYQEKGNAVEARRAYSSCVKEGKRGPVGECRQMLQ